MGGRKWWIIAMLVLVVGPVAWYLGSPLLLNRTIIEPFTGAADVARGTFTDADGFHRGSGTARLVRRGSGHLLRLEELQVTNGPDLYVYLSSHPAPRSRAQVDEGFVSLGRLKGNIGAQTYPVPAEVDLARYRAVVIYCQRFHVVFSSATLSPP